MGRKKPGEGEYDAELRFHLDQLVEQKVAAGMEPEEARRQAILAFGRTTQLTEELRDVHRWAWGARIAGNWRLALRLLRKSPGFSLAVVAMLALGIGANSAVFSAVDAILLRPLPFPQGDRLMKLWQYDRQSRNPRSFVAPVRLEDWNRLNTTCQAISGWYLNDGSETTGSLPERVTEALVGPRFFATWGVRPALGRDFRPEEERYRGPSAVVISDGYWRRKFGGDPHAVGKRLRVEGGYTTVVGVMPRSFLFPERGVDLWTPSPADAPYAQERTSTWFMAVARLQPGVTAEQATSDLNRVQAQLGREFPKTDGQLAVLVKPLKEESVGGSRQSLWLLYGAVSLLLLIACSNIAALLTARGMERQREVAVRFSLGASRADIIWQLLTEYFVLALGGAGVGLLTAWGATQWLRTLTKALPRAEEVGLDWRLVAYTLGCSVMVTLLCGALPALRGSQRKGTAGDLAQAGRSVVSRRSRWQWALVGMQVALAVTLLSGAGLLLRTFQELGKVPLGYDPAQVLTLQVSGNWGETMNQKKLAARVDGELDVLRGTPGVEAAATASNLPGVPGDVRTEFRLSEGADAAKEKLAADSRVVSDAYFAALRMPMLAGQGCERGREYTAVVNASFARSYLPGAGAVVGRHVALISRQFAPPAFSIVGVVADARDQGANVEPYPTVYWCASAPDPTPYFLVRTRGDVMRMGQMLRQRLNAADGSRSVFGMSPLREHVDDTFQENRLRMILFLLFAATAMALAAVGLYGTLSYFVTVRRREVGLRLALGAGRGQIAGRFLRQGIATAALGGLAGLALAAGGSRWLTGLLYGVSPVDPEVYAGVLVLVGAVALVASLIPAVRASRLEPSAVLREE